MIMQYWKEGVIVCGDVSESITGGIKSWFFALSFFLCSHIRARKFKLLYYRSCSARTQFYKRHTRHLINLWLTFTGIVDFIHVSLQRWQFVPLVIVNIFVKTKFTSTCSQVQVSVYGVLHYSALTKTGASLMMKTNQMAELKQKTPTFSNTVN